MAGSAKRRLFGDDPQLQSPVKQISVTPMKMIPNTSTVHNNQNMTSATVLSMAATNIQQLNIPFPGMHVCMYACYVCIHVLNRNVNVQCQKVISRIYCLPKALRSLKGKK